MTHFTLQQKILHHLILHAFEETSPGLLNGQMGMVLALYLAGEETEWKACTSLAEKLFESVTEHLEKSMSFCFSSGLCGIAWGIDFLLNKHFIEGDAQEICEDMDKTIMQINPERLDCSLEYGLEGLLHYVMAHLSSCDCSPFDISFLESLYRGVRAIPANSNIHLQELCKAYVSFYEGGPCTYHFQLQNYISPSCACVTGTDYKQRDFSLATGLSGSLLTLLKLK